MEATTMQESHMREYGKYLSGLRQALDMCEMDLAEKLQALLTNETKTNKAESKRVDHRCVSAWQNGTRAPKSAEHDALIKTLIDDCTSYTDNKKTKHKDELNALYEEVKNAHAKANLALGSDLSARKKFSKNVVEAYGRKLNTLRSDGFGGDLSEKQLAAKVAECCAVTDEFSEKELEIIGSSKDQIAALKQLIIDAQNGEHLPSLKFSLVINQAFQELFKEKGVDFPRTPNLLSTHYPLNLSRQMAGGKLEEWQDDLVEKLNALFPALEGQENDPFASKVQPASLRGQSIDPNKIRARKILDAVGMQKHKSILLAAPDGKVALFFKEQDEATELAHALIAHGSYYQEHRDQVKRLETSYSPNKGIVWGGALEDYLDNFKPTTDQQSKISELADNMMVISNTRKAQKDKQAGVAQR